MLTNTRTLRTTLTFMTSMAVIVGLSAFAAPPVQAAGTPRVIYDGQIESADKRALSGIFPMTFSLYRSQRSSRPVWSETHYVSVQNGAYSLQLGDTRPIPRSVKLDRVYLGVNLTGGVELVRERLAQNANVVKPKTTPTPAVPTQEPTPVAATSGSKTKPSAHDGESYVEIAGFAYEADRAKTADKLGNLTEKEIRKLAEGDGKSGKASLGGTKRYSNSAGGAGGQPYTLTCPKGYVVTGVRGGAAAYLDSITLICSPLE